MKMKMYSYRGVFVLSFVVALSAAVCPPVWATEAEARAALDLIPADAPIVLVVPNPARLSKKIANLGEALGINEPGMADVLGEIKKGSGFVNGIRDDGPLAVAFSDAKALNDQISGKSDMDGPPPILAAVPVADFKALVANFGGNADDAMPQLKTPGGDLYALKKGNVALLATDKDILVKYKQPNDSPKWVQLLGKSGAKNLASSDILVIVNVGSMAPSLTTKIKEAMGIIQAQGANAPGMDPTMAPMFKSIFSIYGDVANALVRDTSVLVISADLSDKGIGLTYTVQFKPDSYMAKTFGHGGGAAEPLLHLPEMPYLAAFSMNFKGIDLKTLMADLAKFPQDDVFGKMLRGPIANTANVKAMAGAVYVPQGKAADISNLINAVTVIQTNDPAAYIKSNKQYLEQMSKFFNGGAGPAAPAGDGQPPAPADDKPVGLSYTVKYTEKAMQVDGMDVDQYEMTMNLPPDALQGPMAIINMMGITKQTGYICSSGDYVVQTMSHDLDLLKQAVAAVKAGKGLGAGKLIAQTRDDGLPSNPAFEMYINANSIASMANTVLGMFGGMQVKLPADLPPFAVGLGLDDGGAIGRLYVPMPLVKGIKEAIDQFQTAPRPDRPHGQPGEPPPPPL